MTYTIVTTSTTPFEFLMNYLHMLGGSPDHPNDEGMSVSAKEEDLRSVGRLRPMCDCGNCGDMIALKFEKEWEGRIISFVEHTCIDCGTRQYAV